VRANDTHPQTENGMNSVLDEWTHKPVSDHVQEHPLTVTNQMISDFEASTGLLGIGKKMLAAGFWRLA
jgi:hypothetical protein